MAIIDVVLALVESADEITPFVFAERAEGNVHATIVTANSARAMILGRRMVRDQLAEATAYAIVCDSFVRIEGVRHDAVLIEHAARGELTAEIVAYPYRATEDGLSIGEAVPFQRRPTALVPLDPHALDWGPIIPDLYNAGLNKAAHSVTHRLDTDDAVDRTIRFLGARARMFARHLPPTPPPGQLAFIDLRGQTVPEARRARLTNGLAGVMEEVKLMTEDN